MFPTHPRNQLYLFYRYVVSLGYNSIDHIHVDLFDKVGFEDDSSSKYITARLIFPNGQ